MRKLTKEAVIAFFDNVGLEIIEDFEYKSVDQSLSVKGKSCGHITYSSVTSIKRNIVKNKDFICPICSQENKHTRSRNSDLFVSTEIDKIDGYKCLDSSKYSDGGSRYGKILILHEECGQSFEMAWSNFHQGKRCPHCFRKYSESKMAQLAKKLLKERNIDFEVEKTFEELRNPLTGKLLRYDIYIPSINTIIEIDGTQHQKAVSYYGGKRKLVESKHRDYIKNKYVLDNKIKLYRIEIYDSLNKKYKKYTNVEIEVYNLIYKLDRQIKKI